MNNGYIKVFRKISDNPIWTSESFTRGQAWIDLILLCNYKDSYIRIRGVKVDVKRGQCGWSEYELAKRWKWSRGKVRRFLGELQAIPQIILQKNNISSLITVINYDVYQSSGTTNGTTNGTASSTTNGQQTDSKRYTNKKEKKEKKGKKEYNDCVAVSEKIDEIISYLNLRTGSNYKSSTLKTKSLINARLNETFTVEDFKIVIDNKSRDWFGTEYSKFLRPETLFGTKFESYLNSNLNSNNQHQNNNDIILLNPDQEKMMSGISEKHKNAIRKFLQNFKDADLRTQRKQIEQQLRIIRDMQ